MISPKKVKDNLQSQNMVPRAGLKHEPMKRQMTHLISSSQTSGFNHDSGGRFSRDSDRDSKDKTSLESPIFLNRWIASGVASTF
jgi:hypothetical protein